jgi:hypothetical protein
MNCRPGDLARIVGLDPRLGLNDRIVKLCDASPLVVEGYVSWRLEQPLEVRLVQSGIYLATGEIFPAGSVLRSLHMADDCLRPIRDPGSDAVDEMVKRVGPAPMTLTEVLERDEVAHG